jgi:hypothetical protein
LHVLSLRALVLVAVAILITACASAPGPQATTSWRDPDFRGPPFRKIFVIGLSAQSLTDQRGFENLMVSTLQGAGIDGAGLAVRSDRSHAHQATMRAAVAQSGADATLLVRLSGFTTETALGVWRRWCSVRRSRHVCRLVRAQARHDQLSNRDDLYHPVRRQDRAPGVDL